ncbi:RNA polymerase sigma-70 factor (ECF subfamily) [Stenotrophomonas rhizophila]|uniref:RNA polymerase sigma factor n=1 Tax=Stenotrophomonas rhizophila TaxID=216778 RepID=UPI000F93102F|nr:RNA polymerase sigma-70 factor (ECF subfamily) [Stenotrophomonas rhizophila]
MTLPRTAHDPRARFAALLEQHRGIVLKVARGYCHQHEDRLDLVQEISVQAWAAFEDFDPARARFSTWLYRVALNVAISQWRRQQHRHHHTPLDDDLPVVDDGLPPEQRHALRQLEVAIHALPPLDRALMLLHLDDHDHRQMAEVLGISITNISTRLHRVRQQLRTRLNPTD